MTDTTEPKPVSGLALRIEPTDTGYHVTGSRAGSPVDDRPTEVVPYLFDQVACLAAITNLGEALAVEPLDGDGLYLVAHALGEARGHVTWGGQTTEVQGPLVGGSFAPGQFTPSVFDRIVEVVR